MHHILVVEDDPDLLFLYQTALAQNGFAVTQAETASSAMTELSHRAFDAVILDLNLPDAHGSVVIDYMLQTGRHSPEKMVIITANDRWVDNISQRGVQYILVKPVSMMQVVDMIERIAQ